MELNLENLIKLMQFRPTLKEAANYFNASEDTIERRIKKFEKLTFSEFKEKYSLKVKHKLINKALEMAMSGNSTMMIFCLKNLCGWDDRAEQKNQEPVVITLAYSKESLRHAASQ
jgi:hypothetical protein